MSRVHADWRVWEGREGILLLSRLVRQLQSVVPDQTLRGVPVNEFHALVRSKYRNIFFVVMVIVLIELLFWIVFRIQHCVL